MTNDSEAWPWNGQPSPGLMLDLIIIIIFPWNVRETMAVWSLWPFLVTSVAHEGLECTHPLP